MTQPPETVLRRVLGPPGPELTCEQCFAEIDRYVELELRGPADADAAIPGMAAHLQGCPACAEEHAALHALLADDRSGGEPPPRPLEA